MLANSFNNAVILRQSTRLDRILFGDVQIMADDKIYAAQWQGKSFAVYAPNAETAHRRLTNFNNLRDLPLSAINEISEDEYRKMVIQARQKQVKLKTVSMRKEQDDTPTG